MNRKDFDLIASVIHDTLHGSERDRLAHRMAEELATRNKQFNFDKFLRRCGVTPSVAVTLITLKKTA